MADKTDDLEQLLLELPERTLTHDAPIAADNLGADAFELHKRLGRVYDAIRHPDTKTPLAIGIFGDWGTGKTSAMRWLDGRLQRWSKKKPAKIQTGRQHDPVADSLVLPLEIPGPGRRLARAFG